MARKVVNVTWTEFDKYLDVLAQNLQAFMEKHKEKVCLLAIGRGSMPACACLAHRLKIKDCFYVGLRSYVGTESGEMQLFQPIPVKELSKFKGIIVIDDIIDTGNTLRYVDKLLWDNRNELFPSTDEIPYYDRIMYAGILYNRKLPYSEASKHGDLLNESKNKQFFVRSSTTVMNLVVGHAPVFIYPDHMENNTPWYTFPWERGID